MSGMAGRLDWNRAIGLLVVLALHGVVLYALWSARVLAPPAAMTKLFVSFVSPEPPLPERRTEPPPKPVRPIPERPVPEKPHTHIAANAPIVSPTEAVEPPPPAAPEVDPPPPPAPPQPAPPQPAPPQPVGPVTLTTELAVSCAARPPPVYPPLSRRLGETGKVVLRVELDETGRVSAAQVLTSSGFIRLDEAALAAVRSWRCEPARRDGQAVHAMATQPFKFTLEGR